MRYSSILRTAMAVTLACGSFLMGCAEPESSAQTEQHMEEEPAAEPTDDPPVEPGDETSCPDPEDPSVQYASEDPDTCQVILFRCDEDQEYFGGACGCGCIDVE